MLEALIALWGAVGVVVIFALFYGRRVKRRDKECFERLIAAMPRGTSAEVWRTQLRAANSLGAFVEEARVSTLSWDDVVLAYRGRNN